MTVGVGLKAMALEAMTLRVLAWPKTGGLAHRVLAWPKTVGLALRVLAWPDPTGHGP